MVRMKTQCYATVTVKIGARESVVSILGGSNHSDVDLRFYCALSVGGGEQNGSRESRATLVSVLLPGLFAEDFGYLLLLGRSLYELSLCQ
jgi:hypothetical protein